MRTTPPPPVDVVKIVPTLAGKVKPSVLLHPRPGPEPPVNASKLGGRFLWPVDEAWPVCDLPEWALLSDYIWSNSPSDFDYALGGDPRNVWSQNHPKHNNSYVGILQLRAGEFSEIKFPDNKNLFQLLWCPRDHVGSFAPVCKVFWRKMEEIINPLPSPPAPTFPDEELMPHPCCLHPERVTEYPDFWELTPAEQDLLMAWDETGTSIYGYLLSTAPGIKVCGYVSWIQEPEVPVCACGRDMQHLLTIASGEYDPATAPRWCPIEEQQIWRQAEQTNYPEDKAIHHAAAEAQNAPGLIIGDCGSVLCNLSHLIGILTCRIF